MRVVFLALALLLLLLLPLSALAAPPKPFSADYQVLRNGERLGQANIDFSPSGAGLWQLHTHTHGSDGLAAILGADVDERSLLRWNGNAPETVDYSYRQELGWKTRERSLRIDAAHHSVVSRDKDRQYSPPYRPGLLDRHAITVAMMQDLASGRRGELTYVVPNRNDIEEQHYRIADTTSVATPFGNLPAVRVERVRDSGDGRSTTIWFASSRDYLPLRIMQREPNGETIEMQIVSVR